jgi:hypothetical protein
MIKKSISAKRATPRTQKKATRRGQVTHEKIDLKSIQMFGVATVATNEGEELLIIGRDSRALKTFWNRWHKGFKPDKNKYKNVVVIAFKQLSKSFVKEGV